MQKNTTCKLNHLREECLEKKHEKDNWIDDHQQAYGILNKASADTPMILKMILKSSNMQVGPCLKQRITMSIK